MQDALRILTNYWNDRGCMVVQPFNTEVGAGTMNPATILRVLGPEPWRAAYVEPSVRPDDSRYGQNPNRLQTHTQFQVILKPDPGNPQELYLDSLKALGIDLQAHDVRFVEDNWAQPAIGAWGLGWEVWLDGMEITQFTYFQQVGGQNLDPVAVELTYGMERILMARQGVTHFKDITYAPGITYGEAFGQAEYEMSRYYLDEADVEANRRLFETFTTEAARLVDARLPVPAHTYVLKSSHVFNVLDSRGAISTTERAQAFSTMRRLARQVCALWVERRTELGFPLLGTDTAADTTQAPAAVPPAAVPATAVPATAVPATGTQDLDDPPALADTPQTLLIEIGTEELPPHVLPATIAAVRAALDDRLSRTRLDHGPITVEGTPRRVIATVADVAAVEPDTERLVKGPRWAAAYDADGNPTRALQGFLRGHDATPDDVVRAEIGGNVHAGLAVPVPGRSAVDVLTGIISETVAGLRSDKNMRWGDPCLSFARPVRWLCVLWGTVVVPVTVSGLVAGRTTYTHRTDSDAFPTVPQAGALIPLLADRGIIVGVRDRRDLVVEGAVRLAAEVGGVVDVEGEAALIDEITNLVEQPHPIRGTFEARYLDLPEQILTTVMRKHQRYLPVRDAQGALLPYFVTVANGDCDDAVVQAGNESVLRARYEDAAFFWKADLAVPLTDLRAALTKLTFEDQLGSMAERATRIGDLATDLAEAVSLTESQRDTLARAGQLAKFDLSTQMVVEMSGLAGFMARECALRAGESPAVAAALFEMEQPRTATDAVPVSLPGALLALADRFDLLMAMFALGATPTGSSDPFGLRRAALGIIRILRSRQDTQPLSIAHCLHLAATRLRRQGVDVPDHAIAEALDFTLGRLAQQLRDEGVPALLVAAVAPGTARPGRAVTTLATIQKLTHDETLRSVVAAHQRIRRILPEGTTPGYDPALLTEPAETHLHRAVQALPPYAPDDLIGYLDAVHTLVDPTNTFFDDILVMTPDPHLRAARLGLLATVAATAPIDIDWAALHAALQEETPA